MAITYREHDTRRLQRRLRSIGRGTFTPEDLAALLAGDLEPVRKMPRRVKRAVKSLLVEDSAGELEKMVGESLDVVPISYLSEALRMARSVCRIVHQDRKAEGTGVLVSPNLLLTNNHVLPSAEDCDRFLAQFNYELDADNTPLPTTEFFLDADTFFWTSDDKHLDTTLVAIGEAYSGEATLEGLGSCLLSAGDDKHAVGDFVSVIQHPNGDYKQIALRDNRVLGRGKGGATLHYAADTLPGSSGSPVFNDQFELVALHHAGGPRLESMLDSAEAVPADSNEGIRISSIVAELQRYAASQDGIKHSAFINAAIRAPQ